MKQNGTHEKEALGLYLHIPFCLSKCNYCDFCSFAVKGDFSLVQEYVDALCNEIAAYRYLSRKYELCTIYFGGGTPSLLSVEQLSQVMDVIYKTFSVSRYTEITLECNPGTTNEDKLAGYKGCLVNRLSIGLQSVSNERLKRLGRIHTYEQFLEQYETARKVGFQNISVDLMSALPGQSLKEYETSLKTVIALAPEHISSYGLIMEEGTPFYTDKSIWESLPEEKICVAMYERTGELLTGAGYEQYEISNYCKPGMYSRHNSSYWIGTPYLGVGLNASSYLQGEEIIPVLKVEEAGRMLRFRNGESMKEYLLCYGNRAGKGEALSAIDEVAAYQYCSRQWREIEVLSDNDRMEEFVFLGLRRLEGIRLADFEQRFQIPFRTIYQKSLRKHINLGNLMCYEKEGFKYVALTPQGMLISNQVFVDFMF